ncbi:hypothetical protein J7E70_32580 [Variovorax paradoxus]|nr:hypothetical protein [Variovorax paradoxus]MBT2305144.1 hypothetical protein [Variovorax paradoxus]
MRNSPAPEVTHGSRRRAYAWGALAALTCPCHLPVPITRRGVSTPARYDAVPRPCPGAVVFRMPTHARQRRQKILVKSIRISDQAARLPPSSAMWALNSHRLQEGYSGPRDSASEISLTKFPRRC